MPVGGTFPPQPAQLRIHVGPGKKALADIDQLASTHAAKANASRLRMDRDPVAIAVGIRAGDDRQDRRIGQLAHPRESFAHLLLLETAFLRVGQMLILAAAACAVVRAGGLFATRAGLENIHDLRAGMVRLFLDDPHPDPVALGGKGDEDHESLRQPGEAVAAKDHLLDRDLDGVAPRRYEAWRRRDRIGRRVFKTTLSTKRNRRPAGADGGCLCPRRAYLKSLVPVLQIGRRIRIDHHRVIGRQFLAAVRIEILRRERRGRQLRRRRGRCP